MENSLVKLGRQKKQQYEAGNHPPAVASNLLVTHSQHAKRFASRSIGKQSMNVAQSYYCRCVGSELTDILLSEAYDQCIVFECESHETIRDENRAVNREKIYELIRRTVVDVYARLGGEVLKFKFRDGSTFQWPLPA
jgi:hypothetical protein